MVEKSKYKDGKLKSNIFTPIFYTSVKTSYNDITKIIYIFTQYLLSRSKTVS